MMLTLLTLLPVAGALLVMLLPREEEGLARGLSLVVSLAVFVISLFLLPGFNPNGWNGEVSWEWIAPLGVRWHLGVDGISLYLLLLTTFLMPVVLLASWTSINRKVREYCATMLVLETGMIGTFLALDLFVFYVF